MSMDRPDDGVTPGEASQSRFSAPIGEHDNASGAPDRLEPDEGDNRTSGETKPANEVGDITVPTGSAVDDADDITPTDATTKAERTAQFMDDLEDDRRERAKLEPPHPQEIAEALRASRPKLFDVHDERTRRHILASNSDEAKQIFDDFQTSNDLPRVGNIRAKQRHGTDKLGRDLEDSAIRQGGFLYRESGQISYRERTRG